MKCRQIVVLGLLLTLVTEGYSGETVTHPRLGFRLTVPDGFEQISAGPQRGNAVYVFQLPQRGVQKASVIIIVTRLGGVLRREKLDPSDFASKHPEVSLSTDKWKSFDLDVSRVPERTESLELINLNAQVPLRPEGIQFTIVGEASREAELREILQYLLTQPGRANELAQH